jgi:hypothetical protein
MLTKGEVLIAPLISVDLIDLLEEVFGVLIILLSGCNRVVHS